MAKIKSRNQSRLRRKMRGRKKISGSAERPRLSVFRSSAHVYVQVIDDDSGKTLASVSSFGKSGVGKRASKEVCAQVGKQIAEKCLASNITKVVFDKGGFSYHGRVRAIADGAREAGLIL